MDFPLFQRDNALLKKVIGLPFCISATPKPNLEASISIMNFLEKFDIASTRTDTIAYFNASNAYCVASLH